MCLETIFENQVIRRLRWERYDGEYWESYIIQKFKDMITKIIWARKNSLECYIRVMRRLNDVKFIFDASSLWNFFYTWEKIDTFSISFAEVFPELREVGLVDNKEECFAFDAKYIPWKQITEVMLWENEWYNFKILFIRLSRMIESELRKELNWEKVYIHMDTRGFSSPDPISQIWEMNIKIWESQVDENWKKVLKLIITDIAINIRELMVRIVNETTWFEISST